jgi:hypothetical protein
LRDHSEASGVMKNMNAGTASMNRSSAACVEGTGTPRAA